MMQIPSNTRSNTHGNTRGNTRDSTLAKTRFRIRHRLPRQIPVRRLTGAVLVLPVILLGLALIGCDVPAQVVWSPDGSQAAYRSGTAGFLLNEQGIVLQPLGQTVGGFAWSSDSKSLYFAATAENDLDSPALTPINFQWLGPTNDPATRPAANSPAGPAIEPKAVVAVNLLRDGKTTPLFHLRDVSVWHLQLSPDGNWLAAMTTVSDNNASDKGDAPTEFRLFVYSLHGGGLYELSRFCGMGACFTGPSTLAFVEANSLDAVGEISGHLVQVKLADGAAALPRTPLLETILPLTQWMEPCKGGMMFIAAPRAFPAAPVPESSQTVYKLYHYSCADGGLTVLADDVGELFDASPDGKRILFEKRTAPEVTTTAAAAGAAQKPPAMHHDLCVMNANGSDPHVLRSLDEYIGDPKPPMWPAWHGDDQITFIATAENAQSVNVDGHDRKVVDLIQYHLTDKGTLEALQSLSGDWKAEIKPYFHSDDSK
jgi:hypothetical protein